MYTCMQFVIKTTFNMYVIMNRAAGYTYDSCYRATQVIRPDPHIQS